MSSSQRASQRSDYGVQRCTKIIDGLSRMTKHKTSSSVPKRLLPKPPVSKLVPFSGD